MTDPPAPLLPAKAAARALHDSPHDDSRSLGNVGFDRYSLHKKGLTFDGRTIPPFRECGPDVQDAWDYAAEFLYELGRLHGVEMAAAAAASASDA